MVEKALQLFHGPFTDAEADPAGMIEIVAQPHVMRLEAGPLEVAVEEAASATALRWSCGTQAVAKMSYGRMLGRADDDAGDGSDDDDDSSLSIDDFDEDDECATFKHGAIALT